MISLLVSWCTISRTVACQALGIISGVNLRYLEWRVRLQHLPDNPSGRKYLRNPTDSHPIFKTSISPSIHSPAQEASQATLSGVWIWTWGGRCWEKQAGTWVVKGKSKCFRSAHSAHCTPSKLGWGCWSRETGNNKECCRASARLSTRQY